MQSWICGSSVSLLRSLYCGGKDRGSWRDATNGTWFITVDSDPPGHVLVEVPPETRMGLMDLFMRNARISGELAGEGQLPYRLCYSIQQLIG
jgi:hypothetical protein